MDSLLSLKKQLWTATWDELPFFSTPSVAKPYLVDCAIDKFLMERSPKWQQVRVFAHNKEDAEIFARIRFAMNFVEKVKNPEICYRQLRVR